MSNAVIGDAEINFVVTLLENVCLSRQVLQLKDFLYSLHSGELNSLFSNCSFHVSDPWGSSAVSAGDEEDMRLVEKAKSRLKKDFLHNDENRYMMFEYVKFVLSRAFVSRPYEILSHETASSLGCVEVLYDMLISSDIQAVWALPSLDQRPMSIPSTDVPSIVKAESTDLFEAQSFEKQVEVALKSAKHELSVHLSVDMVLKVRIVCVITVQYLLTMLLFRMFTSATCTRCTSSPKLACPRKILTTRATRESWAFTYRSSILSRILCMPP